jgi:hypothetical protein
MATIGSLAVNIVANTGKFSAGLAAAQGKLKGFVSSVGSSLTSFQGLIAGAAVGGVAAFVQQTVDAADALGDMATKLSVNVEQLQALRYAAVQMGSSASALDRGLLMLTKNLGLAKAGSKEAATAFAGLGVPLSELVAMQPDQVLLRAADAIKALPTAAEQAAFATRLFGKSGLELLPILRGGSDEITKWTEQLRKVGGVASEDSIKNLGRVKEQLDLLSATFTALKIEFIGDFAPVIKFFLDDLLARLRALKQILEGVKVAIQNTKEILGVAEGDKGQQSRRSQFLRTLQGTTPMRSTPQSKASDKHTEATAKATERTAAAVERMANQQPVQLAVAGVR